MGDDLLALIAEWAVKLVAAGAILVVGWWLAAKVSNIARRMLLDFDRIDEIVAQFVASLIRYALLAVVGLAALSQIGIQTASLIAVFGAAGLAIGLALQGTLSNLAAGVMLLIFRPFSTGDYVEAGGASGTVKRLDLFTSELATLDNVKVIVPNGAVWGSIIKNYSAHDTRRLEIVIGVGYGDDLDKAVEVLTELVTGDPRSHDDPAAQIMVGNLGDSAVDIIIRVWCDAGDLWPLKWDLTKAIKETLDGAGISIPFPQQDVHMHTARARVPAPDPAGE